MTLGTTSCDLGSRRASPLALTVATWNLRLNTPVDGANAWPYRRKAVKALVARHDFHVLGTQEGLADQIDYLDAMPGYARVGVGRDDGERAGEFIAIYYQSERFARAGSGHFWLSETPDRPSLGWDGRCCRRLAGWVRLRERGSGREFVVFSVHFDHEGVVARRESARLLLRRMQEVAGPLPLLCLGDLNAVPQSDPHLILTTRLRDAYDATMLPPEGPIGTFNGFSDGPMRDRIDYVLVDERWRVLRYAAIADREGGRWPSDHLPVMARLSLD